MPACAGTGCRVRAGVCEANLGAVRLCCVQSVCVCCMLPLHWTAAGAAWVGMEELGGSIVFFVHPGFLRSNCRQQAPIYAYGHGCCRRPASTSLAGRVSTGCVQLVHLVTAVHAQLSSCTSLV
jgi:hypothetical protein